MSKLTVVVLALVAVCAHGLVAPQAINLKYHETIGIPAATRIQAAEASRIVGINRAVLGQFPFQLGLIIQLTSGDISICGGSLLTNTRGLTAAHCWYDGNHNGLQVTIVAGSTTLFSGGTRVVTSTVELHNNYDIESRRNDIAIIHFPFISFNAYIEPIPLYTSNEDLSGKTAMVSGYGRTSNNAPIGQNQRLHFSNAPIISNSVCAEFYGPVVTEDTICTSYGTTGGVCDGDTGGPLNIAINGVRYLVGVISFHAAAGCDAGLPSGFISVPKFDDWIEARL